MVLKQVTVCIILLFFLGTRVKAQTVDEDLQKINKDLDKLLSTKVISPSTEDKREYNKELDKLQAARERRDGGNEKEKRDSYSAKSEAKKAFEYYQSRRADLIATSNKLLSLAENLNESSVVRSLKNALNENNNYKEFAIENALEQLVAAQNKFNTPKDPNRDPNKLNDLGTFLDILSKFEKGGGHLFSPNVYNQINAYDPSQSSHSNLNEQLRDLINKLNKRLDSLSKQKYDDWSEWSEWFDWFDD